MAKIPFLHSKLTVPPLSHRHIARPRLVETIDIFLSHGSRMVVVTAPAGYGKTTLLSEWVRTSQYVHPQNISIRWISFEKEEVDVQTFVLLLLSALIIDPHELSPLSAQFEQAQNQQDWLQILSDISELVSKDRLVLVMDDYPWTSNELFQSFLRSLPETFQVVISSRVRPAAWIVRYRLEWQIAEITQLDLRFQDDETLAFLQSGARREIDLKTAEQIARRTEGWAVALQLATWRIHSGTDPREVIKDISGDDNLLLEYLISEVYQKQTPVNQRFLRQTSVLHRLNPEICDAILERNDSASILRELNQSNVFLSALDDEHHWYCYHALFEDFLYKRLLDEDGPEIVKRLHLLACEWYEHQQNATREAANQAMLAGDYARVVKLMETGTYEDVWYTNYPAALNLLLQVPVKEYLNSPWLSILATWVLTLLGSTVGGKTNKEWLEISKTSLTSKLSDPYCDPRLFRRINSEIELLDAFISCSPLSDPPGYLQESISHHLLAEMVYRVHQYSKYKLLGDYRSAINSLQDGYLSSRLKGNLFSTQYFKSVLIFENIKQGRFVEAEKLLGEPEEWLDGSASLFCFIAQVQISQGMLAVQKNQLEVAEKYLEQVSGKYSILSQSEMYAFSIFKVRYYLALRDWQNARIGLTEALLVARDLLSPNYQADVHYLNCLVDLRQGFITRVKQWLSIPPKGVDSHHEGRQADYLLMNSRCQLEVAKENSISNRLELQKMVELLDQAIQEVDVEFSPLRWVEIRIVKALLLQKLGEINAALEEMSAALRLGAPNDYQRLFLDEGSEVKELLLLLSQKRVEPAYCNRLIKAFAQRLLSSTPEMSQSSNELVVTRREREILLYLAQGESNTELAARLCVSLATVKKHLANIYRKLGVDSRRQAVGIARQKGWIKEIHLKG